MFCTNCGVEIPDDANVCSQCGCAVEGHTPVVAAQSGTESGLDIAIKIFMVIGCIYQACLLIPLVWCIPMTVSVFKSLKNGNPIGVGMKLCTLLFVNTIAGICMLCKKD